MQSVKQSIKSFFYKDVIETRTCNVCGNDYEVYDFYIQGVKKGTNAFCEYCYKKEQDELLAKEAMESRNRALLQRYEQISVIPFELENVTFSDYIPKNELQQNALDLSLSYAKGGLDRTTLFFQGDTGLGKSHLSYCIYKTFIDKLVPAIFVDLPSLLTKIKNSFGYKDGSENQEKILKSLSNCELLVLDDIGAEYVKPDANGFESWAADILFQIVNSRQGKKTIYTTNFNSAQLAQKYGMMSKRIISRMMNNAKVIKIEGQDHRLKGVD